MLPTYKQDLPLITIGVVVLNREWIIERMLASVQSQTYPHDRLFVLVVDGKSKDNTVKVAEQVLAESDFNGYEVIVKESNIPEARNICIQNMRGDFLLFWDSDVIMESAAVAKIFELLQREKLDIVLSITIEITVNSINEIDQKWQNRKLMEKTSTTGGFGLISKTVLSKVAFDPDYTFFEDRDFLSRATKMGFKILNTRDVFGFDVNSNKSFSSIYAFDMPLKEALRGIRKKGKIQAQNVTAGSSSISKTVIEFFLANKRYLFYVGYIPVMILTVVGVLIQNLWLSLIFPLYFLLYTVIQLKKRGFAKGLNVAVRSFIVGIPTSYSLLYYCIKLIFKKPKALSSKPTT